MKILHVINDLNSGGAEKLLTDILPLMKLEGHEVSVAIANGNKNIAKFETIFAEKGILVINYNTSFYNPFLILKLVKSIKKGNYNIVHAHLFPSQYWVAFASLFFPTNIKLLKTEHSVFNKRKKYKILRPLEIFVYSKYHKIICITQLVKENLATWIKCSNIVIINNGVNLEYMKLAKRKQLEIQDEIFRTEHYKILMTARFDGVYKDQTTLIDAFAILDFDAQLYFAGDGPALEATRTYALGKNCGDRIHFLGLRTDVYALMSKVNLNVLSTNSEGMSGVALEAMASGKPFIGSSVEGVKDIVPDKSFLFPKKNPEALAAKISAIKKNPEAAETLVIKASKHVEKFDISLMADKYLKAYKRVLA